MAYLQKNRFLIFASQYFGAEAVETFVDFLISTVDLIDILDSACAFSSQSGNQHGNSGSDVGRNHVGGVQGIKLP